MRDRRAGAAQHVVVVQVAVQDRLAGRRRAQGPHGGRRLADQVGGDGAAVPVQGVTLRQHRGQARDRWHVQAAHQVGEDRGRLGVAGRDEVAEPVAGGHLLQEQGAAVGVGAQEAGGAVAVERGEGGRLDRQLEADLEHRAGAVGAPHGGDVVERQVIRRAEGEVPVRGEVGEEDGQVGEPLGTGRAPHAGDVARQRRRRRRRQDANHARSWAAAWARATRLSSTVPAIAKKPWTMPS